MGGIKNKLTSKVKTLLSSLSLTERADERSSSGEVNNNNNTKGFRLPSFSQPSKMPDGRINNTRKLNHLGLYAEKTIDSLRPISQNLPFTKNTTIKGPLSLKGAGSPLGLTEGSIGSLRPITLTKYLSLACFSIAILSTLTLNIITSYSSSTTTSGALNNEASQFTPESPYVGMYIYSFNSDAGSIDTSTTNISVQIPKGGGVAAGAHLIDVAFTNDNLIRSYSLSLSSKDNETGLINETSGDKIIASSSTLNNPASLRDNEWGYAIPSDAQPTIAGDTNRFSVSSSYESSATLQNALFTGLQPVDGQAEEQIIRKSSPSNKSGDQSIIDGSILHGANGEEAQLNYATIVFYGARVTSFSSLPAGEYKREIIYTMTAEIDEQATPQIDSITPDTYALGSSNSSLITITGQNFPQNHREVFVDLNNNKELDTNEYCDIDSYSTTKITCYMPTNTDIEFGRYTVYLYIGIVHGEQRYITIGDFTYTESKIKSSYVDYGEGIGHVQVDYDENMIPITYTGNETTPKWVIADPTNSNSNTDLNWYDYPSKKWANAVTLTEEGLGLYKGKPIGTEIDEQYVLGYWVYIPRYAYKVMRKEVRNEAITDTYAISKGGFEIIFETNNDISKTPATDCDNDASEYQECIKQTKGEQYLSYPGNNEQLKGQTAWATHPAFTWKYTQAINGFDKTYELNGFWIGKFETTGSTDKPTVLPNQLHIGKTQNDGVIDYYNTAKSVAIDDIYNTYGNEVAITSNKNSHGLLSTKSHMQKSNEWGAITILTSSVFGAGIGTVQINGNSTTRQDSSGNMVYGVTGCGPQASGNGTKYQCGGEIGTQQACCSSDTTRAYNGILGKLSSTTQNVYGIYDMVGGSDEYVMGSYTKDATKSSSMHFDGQTQPPYVDLYPNPPFMDQRDGDSHYNINRCTWTLCGGHAIHETNNDQNYLHGMYDAWNDEYSMFPTYEPQYGQDSSWLMRGGSSTLASGSGLYSTSGNNGNTYWYSSFRITLILI